MMGVYKMNLRSLWWVCFDKQGNRSHYLILCSVFPTVGSHWVQHSISVSMGDARQSFTPTRTSAHLYSEWLRHIQCSANFMLFYEQWRKAIACFVFLTCFLSLLWADSLAIPSVIECLYMRHWGLQNASIIIPWMSTFENNLKTIS